jgi:hypothetical protein
MAQSIDTLGFAKYLEDHGIHRADAEAFAEATNQFLFPQIATKDDLKVATSDMQRAMAELKHDLTVRIVTIVGLIQGLAVALIKLT